MLQMTKAMEVAATTFHLDGSSFHFLLMAFCGPALTCSDICSSELSRSKSPDFRTLATFRLSGALARGCLGASSLCQSRSSRLLLTCLFSARAISLLCLLHLTKEIDEGRLPTWNVP